MQKRFILSSVVALVLSSQILTADEQTSINELKKEISALKIDLKNYKKMQEESRKDIEDLYDFSEQVETKTLQDKLNFGLGYKVIVDNFEKRLANSKTISNNNVISNKLMLNLKADITKSMKFHARLSMYKYWGSAQVHPYTMYDNMQGRAPAVSTLFVERTYFDWFLNQDGLFPFALTVGRQPSADGPSQQLKDNLARKATYSALLYDGASDGAMITLNLSKSLHYDGTYLRFGYAKGFLYTESQQDVTNAFVGTTDKQLKDTDVYGVFFDTKVPGIRQSLIQLSYTKIFDIVANQLDSSSTNTNIGDFSMYGFMLELTNIEDTHLDLFAHYGHSTAYPNQNSYSNFGGLLSASHDDSVKDGDAFWLGTRYSLDKKQKFKLGLEYNHGTKNWVSLTQGSFDVYNKLSTRGDAYEAYLSYAVNRYANIRLGYIALDYKFTKSGWFVGESQKISDLDTTDVDKLSSLYIKMSLNY